MIHAAFDHHLVDQKRSSEAHRSAIAALGRALAESDRPFVVTWGAGLVRPRSGAAATKADERLPSAQGFRSSPLSRTLRRTTSAG